jgi:hypothetical protein
MPTGTQPSFTLLISIRSRTPPNWLAFFFPVLTRLSRLPLHPADGAQQTTSPFPWLHRQVTLPSSLRRRRPSLPSPSNRAALPSLRRCAGELRLPPSPFAGGPRNRAALPSLIQPVSPHRPSAPWTTDPDGSAVRLLWIPFAAELGALPSLHGCNRRKNRRSAMAE